jgi:glycosyltransferase involved in cell wall biosynthesis
MKISIVIPAYNEAERIQSCIESCLEFSTKNLLEIIVVVNASTDNTERIAKRFSTVRVVHERRKGTSYARQKGFECSHGDIIAFVDADTHIHAEWLNDIDREFTSNDELVCLSGPCVYDDLPHWQSTMLYYFWLASALPMY